MGYPRGGKVPAERSWVGLPPRPFLYTIDQISQIISVEARIVQSQYIWYEGRSVGARRVDQLRAINIAPRDRKPEWRVAEQELIRWMRTKKLRYYERGWVE
jgi:hypothetical protein